MPNSPSREVSYRYKDNLKRNYGMEVEEYLEKVNEQQGACAICKKYSPTLCVDHDHDTLKNRGLLCHKCNVGLGHFNDNIQLLADAISYLAQHA